MNRKKRLSLYLACFLTLFVASVFSIAAEQANSPTYLFEQANRAYSQGDYSHAVDLYEAVIASHGLSASLYYNLGNSCAQNSQTGKAILAYLRAIRLAPNNSDIKGNLQLIRKEKGLFQPEMTKIQRITHILELDQWCLVAAIILVFLTFLHLLCFFFTIGTKGKSSVSILLMTLFLLSCFSGYDRYQDYYNGVVTAKDVQLRISPFQAASSTGKIQEGRVVTPLQSHGDYTLVKDGSGRSGWIHQQDFELIVEKQ